MRADIPSEEPTLVAPEVAELPDRDVVFFTPRSGDWMLLLIMIATLLGCGGYVWFRLGFNDHIGRAVFFGLALLGLFWTALIYVFKLSLSIHVGPQGISVVRGPWRMEMRWSEVGRLMERVQAIDNRRFRWVVAQSRDERRIQVREDMVNDYHRFRMTVYEYYRAWRDHGGTWGTASGGPFVARELVGDEMRWWLIGMAVSLTPGLYFLILLPEANRLGYALVGIGLLCLLIAMQALALRQSYLVEAKMIAAQRSFGSTQLGWREVSKVERSRRAVGGVIRAVVAVCRVVLAIAARSESGLRCFPWSPRVPEYLTLRGAGRRVVIRLHRLARPDELLAWIEFYEHIGRRPAASQSRSRSTAETVRLAPDSGPRVAAATVPLADLSEASGPHDPWAMASAIATPDTQPVSAGAVDDEDYEEYDDGDGYTEDDDDGADSAVNSSPDEQDEDSWLRSTVVRPTIPSPRQRISAAPTSPVLPITPPLGAPPARPTTPAASGASASVPGALPITPPPDAPSWYFPPAAQEHSAPVGSTRRPAPSVRERVFAHEANDSEISEETAPYAATPGMPDAQSPTQTSSTFTAISREELLAELNQFSSPAPSGKATPAPQRPLIPQQPPAPLTPPAPQWPPTLQRPPTPEAPPADRFAEAPIVEVAAAPSGSASAFATEDEPVVESAQEGEVLAEHDEPERPWLGADWQPPVLPRFGPGGYTPPDDAD